MSKSKFKDIDEWLEYAKIQLKPLRNDSEAFHSKFDELIEARLTEVDPVFMKTMKRLYEESGAERWCA